jgi:hypothetical protein
MPVAATVNQTIQIAPQTAFGTPATTGFKILKSMGWTPQVGANVQTFRATGQRFDGVSILNDEWAGGAITGVPDYNELAYLFSAALGTVTPTRIIPSTGLAYSWPWALAASGAITRKHFTVEIGDGTIVERAEDGTVDSFALEWTRSGSSVSGSFFGKPIKDEVNNAITKTAGATAVAAQMVPIAGTHVNIYLADTLGGLAGATALGIPFRYNLSLGALMARITGLNRTTGGVDTVEGIPDPTLTLRLPVSTQTRQYVAKMRSGARQFVRLEAQGALIETGTPDNYYKLTIDSECVVANAPGEKGDEGGAFAQDLSYRLAGAGLPNVTLINTLATL